MKIKVLRVTLFFLAIIIIPIFTFAGKKETVSYNENKTLATMPVFSLESWKSRSFMTGMADYISDHFVLRESFIRMKNSIDKAIGKNEINGVFELNGSLIQSFRNPDYKLTDKNLKAINDLAAKNTETQFFFMPVFTAQEKYKSDLPRYLDLTDESDYVEYCKNSLSGVTFIDTKNAINSCEYAFYNTDHHWTTDCAFAAYTDCANVLGFTPKKSSDFRIETVSESFKGTLYSKTLNESIPADSIRVYKTDTEYIFTVNSDKYTSLYFENHLEEKDKYSYFLNGNHGLCTVENTALKNGRKLLLIKDSYANCMLPFLAEHYSEITLVDPRYASHKVISGIDPSEYDQVLVLFNIDGFSQEQNFALITFMEGNK